MPEDNHGRIEVKISRVAKDLTTDGCGRLQAPTLAKPRCCHASGPLPSLLGPSREPGPKSRLVLGDSRVFITGRGGTVVGTVPWLPVLTQHSRASHISHQGACGHHLREWLCRGLGTSWLRQPPCQRPLREEASAAGPMLTFFKSCLVFATGSLTRPGAHR